MSGEDFLKTSDSELVKNTDGGAWWLISCIVCCVCALYITIFSYMPLIEILGFIVFSVFVCLYSALLNSQKTVLCVIVPAVGAAGFLSVLVSSSGFSDFELSLSGLNLIFLLACSLVLFFCAKKKASRSVSVASLAASYTAYVLCFAALIIFEIYGSLNIETLKKAVSDISSLIAEMYTSLLTGSVSDISSDSEMQRLIEQFSISMENTVRNSIPSIIITYCTVISAVSLLFYKTCVKAVKAVDENLGSRNWTFTMSGVSVGVFYISYVLYFVSGLFSTDSAFYCAFMNISSILTYPFAYLGLRSVYTMLCSKIKSRIGSAVIIGAGVLIITFVFGALSLVLTMLAFIGASMRFGTIISKMSQ